MRQGVESPTRVLWEFHGSTPGARVYPYTARGANVSAAIG
jgi:hypothetical protein